MTSEVLSKIFEDMPSDSEKVLRLLEDLKVNLVVGPFEANDHACPVDGRLAIRFPDTLIIAPAARAKMSPHFLGTIVHELGHLLVAKDVESDEYDFLGWEFAIAERYDLLQSWYYSIYNYGVGTGSQYEEFGVISKDRQTEVLDERLDFAKAAGYLQAPYFPG